MIPTIKNGASIRGLRPEMVFAWTVYCQIMVSLVPDVNAVLTEGTGGKHKVHSLHYVGQAMDLRSNSIPKEAVPRVMVAMQRALGPDFQFILEDKGTPNEHFHVEYQP